LEDGAGAAPDFGKSGVADFGYSALTK